MCPPGARTDTSTPEAMPRGRRPRYPCHAPARSSRSRPLADRLADHVHDLPVGHPRRHADVVPALPADPPLSLDVMAPLLPTGPVMIAVVLDRDSEVGIREVWMDDSAG